MAASKSKDAVRHCFPFEPYMHHEWQYEVSLYLLLVSKYSFSVFYDIQLIDKMFHILKIILFYFTILNSQLSLDAFPQFFHLFLSKII